MIHNWILSIYPNYSIYSPCKTYISEIISSCFLHWCFCFAVEFFGHGGQTTGDSRLILWRSAGWKPWCTALNCDTMCLFKPRGSAHYAQGTSDTWIWSDDPMPQRLLRLQLWLKNLEKKNPRTRPSLSDFILLPNALECRNNHMGGGIGSRSEMWDFLLHLFILSAEFCHPNVALRTIRVAVLPSWSSACLVGSVWILLSVHFCFLTLFTSCVFFIVALFFFLCSVVKFNCIWKWLRWFDIIIRCQFIPFCNYEITLHEFDKSHSVDRIVHFVTAVLF